MLLVSCYGRYIICNNDNFKHVCQLSCAAPASAQRSMLSRSTIQEQVPGQQDPPRTRRGSTHQGSQLPSRITTHERAASRLSIYALYCTRHSSQSPCRVPTMGKLALVCMPRLGDKSALSVDASTGAASGGNCWCGATKGTS